MGFADASWALPSISGGVIYLFGFPVSWFSRKQQHNFARPERKPDQADSDYFAQSAPEAEYIALGELHREIFAITNILQEEPFRALVREAGYDAFSTVKVFTDSTSARYCARNFESKRMKHIPLAYHMIRQAIVDGRSSIYYIDRKQNVSDILTRPQTPQELQSQRNSLLAQTEQNIRQWIKD